MSLDASRSTITALDRIVRTLLYAFLIGVFLGAITASAVIGLWLET